MKMKEFKKTLKTMEFKKVTPSVFYFDNNGTFYVVSFKSGTFRLAMRDAAP